MNTIEGRPSPLPPPGAPFTAFADWQRRFLQGPVLDRHRAYWHGRLRGLTRTELPTDRPRQPQPPSLGSRVFFTVPAATCDRLNRLARTEQATLFMALLGAFKAVLARYCGQDDISVAVPIANRPQREFESIVGFLDNDQWEYFLCLGIAVLLFVLAWNLMNSRMGRAIVATRDREIAAATVGVNLSGVKVGTFAISAAYAGVAGSLSVMVDKVADATNPITYFELSIKFLVAVVIGGAATILGPALGALVLTLLEDQTDTLIADKPVLSPAVLGIALIVIVFVLPEGLLGGIRRLVNKVSTWWAGRRSATQVNRS